MPKPESLGSYRPSFKREPRRKIMPSRHAVDELVRTCQAARLNGADFPTVWNTILRNDRRVAGTPVQAMENGKPLLQVRLVTGQQIVYGPDGYALA
jgi:hypothetical protein